MEFYRIGGRSVIELNNQGRRKTFRREVQILKGAFFWTEEIVKISILNETV